MALNKSKEEEAQKKLDSNGLKYLKLKEEIEELNVEVYYGLICPFVSHNLTKTPFFR
jgi:hypothetical protein